MAEQSEDLENPEADEVSPATQPADSMVDSSAQSRPVATQAISRPDFDDDDDDFSARFSDTMPIAGTKPTPRAPVRRLGGGMVEIPRLPDIDPLKAVMPNPVVP